MTEIAFLAIKGLLAVCLVAGGLYALKIGYRLYLKGVGLVPDGSEDDGKNGALRVKASLKTVGSVVMATSVAWGALGYFASPKSLTISPTKTEVANGELDLEVAAPKMSATVLTIERLSEMLQTQLASSDLPRLSLTATLASFGYDDAIPSFAVVPDSSRAMTDSTALLGAVFRTNTDSVRGHILYQAMQSADSVRFIPKMVTFTVGDTATSEEARKN